MTTKSDQQRSTTLSDDFAWMDAIGQAGAVRRREVPPELVRAAIERAERINPALNAILDE